MAIGGARTRVQVIGWPCNVDRCLAKTAGLPAARLKEVMLCRCSLSSL